MNILPVISKRILIADDEQTSLVLMRATLEKAGFEVITAANGKDALNQFQTRPSDMVMLDVEMPYLNGFEVLTLLRQDVGGDLPIVMVTGKDDMVSVEKAYRLGATDFISKPINWSLLGHRIKYIFRDYQNLIDLHTANERNSAILSAIPDILIRIDRSGLVLDSYTEARNKLSILPGQPLSSSLPSDVTNMLVSEVKLAHHTKTVKNVDFTLKDSAELVQHFETRIVSINEEEALCLVRDITEKKESEYRIYKLAYFDTLTGLPNRRSFLKYLAQKIKDHDVHSSNDKLAVLFIGLDRFKVINDTLGYSSGDQLLKLAADRLLENLKTYDTITYSDKSDLSAGLARPGGDEFIVLIQTKDLDMPLKIAE